MKKLYLLPLFLGGFFYAQNFKADSTQFKKISDEIFTKGKGYEDLRELTKNIGNRLSEVLIMKKLHNGQCKN
jgi:hypothetical protein